MARAPWKERALVPFILGLLFCVTSTRAYVQNPQDVGIQTGVQLTLETQANSYRTQSDIVIEGKLFINMFLALTGSNVTIRNCRFIWNDTAYNSSNPADTGVRLAGLDYLIEFSEFLVPDPLVFVVTAIGVIRGNVEVRNCFINGTRRGVFLQDNVSVISNYILLADTQPIYALYHGGTSPSLELLNTRVLIENNTILVPVGETAAIYISGDFGNARFVTVRNNLLAGGATTVYGGIRNRVYETTTEVQFLNNVFSTRYFMINQTYYSGIRSDGGGVFGPISSVDFFSGLGNQWCNNTWDDGPSAGLGISDDPCITYDPKNCSGPKPIPIGAYCYLGSWVVDPELVPFQPLALSSGTIVIPGILNLSSSQSIFLSAAIVNISGSLYIEGNSSLSLSLDSKATANGISVDSSSLVLVSLNSTTLNDPPIVITECANLSGTLRVTYDPLPTDENVTVTVISAACFNGQFGRVIVSNPDGTCERDGIPTLRNTQLTVAFSLSSCHGPSTDSSRPNFHLFLFGFLLLRLWFPFV